MLPLDSRWISALVFAFIQGSLNASSTMPPINDTTCDMLNCTGHSKCVNGTKPGELTCRCVYGFTGENCDTDVDECALGNPCYYRGYCNNTYGSWSCVCLQGWRGTEHCQEKIDIYENRKCVPGHMGEDCFDTCLYDSMCNPSEECIKVGRGLGCKCKKGYLLPNCTDIDECASSPCDITSTCVNTPGSYHCDCASGWEGGNCSTDIDECSLKICQHNASCTNLKGSYACSCTQGWAGINCTYIDQCLPNPCTNSGTCLNTQAGTAFSCICKEVWRGQNCTYDVDECHITPCQNFGTCNNIDGSYSCSCSNGWTGKNCTEDIDECTMKPCKHFGTCRNNNGSFSCLCPSTWKGDTCDIFDFCASSPCSNSSICESNNGSFECHCFPGWTGTLCSKDVDECLQNRCNNSGRCINSPGSFICNCTNGWEGDFCEKDSNECDDHPCNATSSCVNAVGSFNCVLIPGHGKGDDSVSNAGMIVGIALGCALGFASILTAVLIALYKWLYRKVKDTNGKQVTKQSTEREEFDRSHDASNQELRFV